MKHLTLHRRRGFTLLELLVVISIIGILIAMGAVAFSTAQQRGRDSKRRGDAKAVQSAFEQYYVANGSTYGASCAAMAAAPYMAAGMPSDPRNTGSYVYSCASTASTYCFCAFLEADGSGNASDASCTYATGATADYFCVSNLQ